ncbi:MAG: transcriptional regulator [Lutibacter sp.]|nr:MAG: transcriptional regulator [Lutibacter sp.]
MGVSKVEIYPQHINDIAQIAKVFSHPARVAILQYISIQESCICNDIVEEIGLSQSTISQHLKVINNAGLLQGTFEGKKICYCINIERFEMFQKIFDTFFNRTKQNCC